MATANYPPLTTAFHVPTSCYSQPKTAYTNKPSGGGTELDVQMGLGCAPPNPQIATYYSPGMCPYDWTTAVHATMSGSQTVAACCPIDYPTQTRVGNVCASSFSTPSTVPCLSDYSKSALPSGTCQPTVVSSGVVVVLPFFVIYEQKDLSLFPSGYTPGQLFTTSANETAGSLQPTLSTSRQTASSTTASTSATSTSGTKSSHLSTGAKIGIGVGVSIGVILQIIIAYAGYLYGVRRRKARDLTAAKRAEDSGFSKHELDGSDHRAPVELESSNAERFELPADAPQRDEQLTEKSRAEVPPDS